MVAVNEINVGVAGRAEQDRGAGCVASGGMRGRVVDAEVGFDFDDASGEMQLAGVAEKDLAEEVASYAARAAGEEGASERVRHKSGCSQRGAEAPLFHLLWSILPRCFEVVEDLLGVAFGFYLGENVLDFSVGPDDEGGADDAHHFLAVHIFFLENAE